MSGPTQSENRTARQERVTRLAVAYHRVDGAVFSVEAAIVTAATSLMIVFVFLDLAFTFVNGVRLSIFPPSGTSADGGGRIVSAVVALGLVLALIVAAVGAHPRWKARPLASRAAISLGIFAATCGLLAMFATVHARWTCLTFVVLGGAYALVRIRSLDEPVPKRRRYLAIWAITVALLVWFSLGLPDRYSSWTLPYALFLLLWTGFIGASMATSQGRHLRIDAVRKVVPPHRTASYNAVSLFVAAAITGVLCYLSWRYMLARFGNPTTAGEIPDWLKVLAIPVSLALIALRFLMRSVLAALGHVEQEVSEVVIPAETKGEG